MPKTRLRAWIATLGVVACPAVAWLFHGPLIYGPTIEFRVLSGGVPLAGAWCYPMPCCSEEGPTDEHGRFSLSIPMFDFGISSEFCVTTPNGRRTRNGELPLPPWWSRHGVVDVELGAGGIAGQVVDADGVPAGGRVVWAASADEHGFGFDARTTSDEHGLFRLGPLLPGTYLVVASDHSPGERSWDVAPPIRRIEVADSIRGDVRLTASAK